MQTAQILTTLPGHSASVNCTQWLPSAKFAFKGTFFYWICFFHLQVAAGNWFAVMKLQINVIMPISAAFRSFALCHYCEVMGKKKRINYDS